MDKIINILKTMVDGSGRTIPELVEIAGDDIIFSVISNYTKEWAELCEMLKVDIKLDIDVQLICVLIELKNIAKLGAKWHKN